MSPNDSVWQGVLLGLGDDGTTYHCQGDTWQPYITPLNPQDKAAELTAVTEQRDAVTLRLGNTQERMFNAERQRDRLAEAIRKHKETLPFAPQPCDKKLYEALQSLTPNEL
jgi:hypothetical protein